MSEDYLERKLMLYDSKMKLSEVYDLPPDILYWQIYRLRKEVDTLRDHNLDFIKWSEAQDKQIAKLQDLLELDLKRPITVNITKGV